MDAKLVLQLSGLLGDLMFVGALFGTLLYGLWLFQRSRSLVGLGRLSLVLAFGAAVVSMVLGQGYLHGLSYPIFYLFLLWVIFLSLEFLFQMSVLGLLVSALGAIITSARYWTLPPLPAELPPNPQVAYWWVLRDLAFTTGAAVTTLALGATVLLAVTRNQRPSDVVHPNDLRDVGVLLARGTVPCYFFALFAAVAGVLRNPRLLWADVWEAGWLVALFALAIWLLFTAGDRRAGTGRVLLVALLLVVGMLAYALGPMAAAGLTMGPVFP